MSYIWSESFGVVPSVRKVQCFCGLLKTVVLIILMAGKQLDVFVGKQLAFLESVPNLNVPLELARDPNVPSRCTVAEIQCCDYWKGSRYQL